MPLENRLESELPPEPLSPLLNREAREAANGWLSRLSPLLDRAAPSQVEQCRKRVALVEALRPDGEQALMRMQQQAAQKDATLLQTLRDALAELDGIESDLRRRLAALSPGDPEGEVDLESMRAKLAEAAARREVASVAGPLGVQSSGSWQPLTLATSEPAWGAALVTGLFSMGWLAFTTFHATLMIGGMFRAVGFGALALLLFYAMFWAVGLGMAWSAIRSASHEEVTLNGREMTIRRWLGAFRKENRHTLGPESNVYVNIPSVRGTGIPATELAIRDGQGKQVRFGGGCPAGEQPVLRDKINTYLNELPRDPGNAWGSRS